MSLPEPFKELTLDAWYKSLVYIGGVALIISFSFEVKGINNIQLQLLASGFFFFGLGEWKNHKNEYAIKPPNAYTGPPALITFSMWKPDIVGLLFDLVGIVLIALGIINIAKGVTSL